MTKRTSARTFILLLAFIVLVKSEGGFLKYLELDSIKDLSEAKLNEYKSFEDRVLARGYKVETHYITTADGYILKTFRVPGKLNDVTPKEKVAVLWHGILDSAEAWIISDDAFSVPFNLVEQGFEIWFPNSRGNKHSRRHVKLNPDKDSSFWDFSFHDMGKYDIPAVLDFITNLTKRQKVSFIGHSQGTSQMFAAMSENVEYYQQKLNGFVALGPVTNLKYSSSYVIQFAIKVHLDTVANFLGIQEFLRGPEYSDPILGYLCNIFSWVCDGVLGLIADKHPDQDDPKKLPEYMANFPSGTSVKCLTHYAQINRRGSFVKFDYGKDKNNEIYGQPTSPEYKVENIKNIPICMLFGSDDHLSGEKDNNWLKGKLEENKTLHLYKMYDKMGHLTYFVPRDNRFLLDTLDCVKFFNQ